MHGSRPDLFQLRQLILAAVIITGAIAIIGGVVLCSSHGFSQSAAMAITIAKMDVGSPPVGFQFARTGQGALGSWIVVSDETSFAAGAGKVALWTKADSVTRFDQIAVDVLPEQEQRR